MSYSNYYYNYICLVNSKFNKIVNLDILGKNMQTLYLIKSNNYLKIGITNNLKKRLVLYKMHNPNFLIIDTREGTFSDEYFLHKIFEKYMIDDTEWMLNNSSIIDIFKSIKLNHKESISKANSNKRKKHVLDIINKRKKYRETNTIWINKNGKRKTYH